MTGAATAEEPGVALVTAVVEPVGGGDGGGGGGGAGATACRLRSTGGSGTSSPQGGAGRGLNGLREAARGLAWRRETTGGLVGRLPSGLAEVSTEECCCRGESSPSATPSIGGGFLVGFLPFRPPPRPSK